MKLALLDKSTVAQVVNSPTLLNRKFHYCFQNSPALIHFLSQISPIPIFTPYSCKSYFNIITPITHKPKLMSNSSISHD
jgi:hypothetical protein